MLGVAVVVGAASCGAGSTHSVAPVTMFSEADAYERFMGRWSRLLAPLLVDLADIRDGDVVLDVGTGTGVLALRVQESTGAASITGIDPSADYIAYAQDQTEDPRVRFEIGDGQALRFDDAAFDRTLSLLVLNFIPDRERALAEMIRVTRPGGVVVAAVWDYSEEMEMLRVFWDAATALDPGSAALDEANMPLCKRGELEAFWRAAGLEDVREVPLVITLRFESWDDYWAPFLLGQGPAGAYVAALPHPRQDALAARLREQLLGPGPDHPFELRARAWAVRGIRP